MYYFYSICTENPAQDEATIMMEFGDEVHVVKDMFHLLQILTDTVKKSKALTIDWWVYFATFMEEDIVLNKVWWVQKLGKSESWWAKVSQLGVWLMNNTAIRRVLRPAPETHDLLKEFMFLLLDFFKPKSGGCSLPVWVIYLPRSLPPVCLLCGLPPRWKSPSLQQRQHLVPQTSTWQ